MDIHLALENRDRVGEFQRRHRVGLLTFLFTRVTASEVCQTDVIRLIREHLAAFKEGEEITAAESTFFIVFTKPSEAVRFALSCQARLRSCVAQSPTAVTARMAIHIGEVPAPETEESQDLYPLQVAICARVMSVAAANQTLLTRSAFDNARQVLKGEDLEGVSGLSWLNHGSYLVEGIGEPFEICEVGEARFAPQHAPPDSAGAHRQVGPDEEPVLGWRPALGQEVPATEWVLERKLGEGGFGEVWLGRHRTDQRSRVFKFCFRADQVRSLKREVTLFRILKERVGRHPNVTAVHDIYFDTPPYYITTDYAEGGDLRGWSETHGGLAKVPLETRLEIIAQVADALQAAHEAGLVHRDVKPTNILIDSQEPMAESPTGNAQHSAARRSTLDARPAVKLTDFGIGQVVSEEILAGITRFGFTQTMMSSGSTQNAGTFMYMSPELLSGKPASPRSDIYSLGVVLYQMILGDLSRSLATGWEKDITDNLLKMDLMDCLAGSAEERFVSARQLAANLRSLSQRHEAVAAQREQSGKTESSRAYRRGLFRGLVVLPAALIAFLILLNFFATPLDPQLRVYLSDAQWKLDVGRTDEALDLAQKAVAMAPNHREALATLAWAFLEKKQYDEALKMFLKILGPSRTGLPEGGREEDRDASIMESAFQGIADISRADLKPEKFLHFCDEMLERADEMRGQETRGAEVVTVRIRGILAQYYALKGNLDLAGRVWQETGILNETNWFVIGTFSGANYDLAADLRYPFIPEGTKQIDLNTQYEQLVWKQWPIGQDAPPDGFLDVGSLYQRRDRGIAYAYTSIWCPDRRAASIHVWVSTENRVWINGEERIESSIEDIFHPHAGASYGPYGRRNPSGRLDIPVLLEPGTNSVLVKIGLIGWRRLPPAANGFMVWITDTSGGKSFKDLVFRPPAKDEKPPRSIFNERK